MDYSGKTKKQIYRSMRNQKTKARKMGKLPGMPCEELVRVFMADPSLVAIPLLERQTIEILPLFARQRRDIDRRVKGTGYTHASATRKLILDKNTEER